jgi:hypothetical protein
VPQGNPATANGADGLPSQPPKTTAGQAQVYLVYDDEEFSMEEKRAQLQRYKYDDSRVQRLAELESRLGAVGSVLGM